MAIEDQPLAEVEWIDREKLQANDWNPNRQAPSDLDLLALSIIEDGWTQPIVVRPAKQRGRWEIVDGFHRWTVSARPEISELTGGKVPIVKVRHNGEDARVATVRHNRARGTDTILRLADLLRELQDAGMDAAEISRRLGMEDEELIRLLDQRPMPERAAAERMSFGWTVSDEAA